jgi:hypothetical protein
MFSANSFNNIAIKSLLGIVAIRNCIVEATAQADSSTGVDSPSQTNPAKEIGIYACMALIIVGSVTTGTRIGKNF